MQHRINTLLDPISPNEYIGAYLSSGIQLYDFIEWVLKQTGRASVKVVTFSISEEFIRKIWMLEETGLVEDCVLILDVKAIQKSNKLIEFSKNIFSEVHYTKTHVKLVLIENAEFKISITTSQNATRGNRLENGLIVSNEQVFQLYKSQIDNIIDELYNQ